MAKSTVHIDKLGSFDNFRAPWQTETGEDAEIVPATLARLIYNLKLDKARAADAAEDAKASLAVAESERDEAKAQAADGTGAESQKTIDKLKADLEKVTGERDDLVKDKETATLRDEVLGDFATKYPKAAKFITGETQEELEESLADVKDAFGIKDGDEGDDEDGDDDDEDETDLDKVVRTAPRSPRLNNVIDRDAGKGGQGETNFDKVADQILSGGRVFG